MVTLPALVDRQEEVAQIAEALGAVKRGEGRMLLLRGEAGCGKTRLAQEAVAHGVRRGFATGFGTALAESVIPYHPWKEALEGLGLAHLLEEHAPPKLLGLYVLTARGRIAAKMVREGEGSVPAAAVSALRAFVRREPHDMKVIEEGSVAFLSRGALRVIVQRVEGLTVGAVLERQESESFLEDFAQLVHSLESTPSGESKSGALPKGSRVSTERLRTLLASGEYDGIDEVQDDPRVRQDRLFEEISRALSRKARLRPQLVAIDDLQWADPSSLALLLYIARNTRLARVVLVGTYRVEEAGVRQHLKGALARIEQEGLPAEILISGLPRSEMRRLAEVFVGRHALPGPFLDLLWQETQGYPLFVREVLRGLEVDGAIRIRGGVMRLEREIEELAIPRRVRDAIRARLEKLPKEDRRLLDAAAACGTRFATALLARVAGEEESRVLPGLDNLCRVHGLLRPEGNGFSFDHPVVQEVAYAALSSEARRAYHTQAAEWLEIVGGPVEDIAEHYYRVRNPRAVAKLREAADTAFRRYANEEAERFLSEALELAPVEERPDLLERLGRAYEILGKFEASTKCYRGAVALVQSPERRAELLTKLGWVQRLQGDPNAVVTCEEALRLVAGRGVREEAAVLRVLGVIHDDRDEPQKALEYQERALAICEELGDEAGLVRVLNNIGVIYMTKSHAIGKDPAAGARYYERSLALAERIGDLEGVARVLDNFGPMDTGNLVKWRERTERNLKVWERLGNRFNIALTSDNLGNACHATGEYERALQCYRRSLAIREQLGNLMQVAWTLGNMGHLFWRMGDFDRATECLRRSRELCEATGDSFGVANAIGSLGRVNRDQGDFEAAFRNMEEGLRYFERLGEPEPLADSLTDLAETHLRGGDRGKALAFLRRAFAHAAKVSNKMVTGKCHLVRGIAKRMEGEWKASVEELGEAIRIATESGAKPELAAAHYELGLTWGAKGDQKRAREELQVALEEFQGMGVSHEVEKARTALSALDAGSPPPRRRGSSAGRQAA